MLFRIRRFEDSGVKFMLARHSGGCFAADELSHENELVLRVAAALAALLMAYAPELGLQSAGMSVDVSDDVVHDLIPGRSSKFTVPTVELGCHLVWAGGSRITHVERMGWLIPARQAENAWFASMR